MNCQNFATLAPELARGSLVEASARDAARTHADACHSCAARLNDERALAEGLRALARDARESEAPARVEAALLARFRAGDWNGDATRFAPRDTAARDADATRAAEVVTREPARGLLWFPRWAQGAAVAAASMLLVFGLYGLFVKRAAVTDGERASAPPQATSHETQTATAATQNSDDPATKDDSDARDLDAVGGETSNTTAAVNPVRAHRRGARATDAGFGGSRTSAGSRATSAGRPLNNAADETAEITTDFIPLVHDGLAPVDSGHLVRVELPRDALARFGLPLNAERSGGRVKADVLMGDDGIARAIRFVR